MTITSTFRNLSPNASAHFSETLIVDLIENALKRAEWPTTAAELLLAYIEPILNV